MKSARPKILVYHSLLDHASGAGGVAAWILQALRDDFEVTLLTWQPFDLQLFNSLFGTSLRPSDYHLRTIPRPVRKLIEFDPDRSSIQKHMWLMRVSKRIRQQYDLVVSACDEGDFGAPAIQYVHYPLLAHVRPRVRASCDLPAFQKWNAVRRGEIRPWMLLGDFSFDRMKRNRTLVNSDWTGRVVQRAYDIETVTVHPPASGTFPAVPWERRDNSFVMVGRLTPGKRPHWVIGVLNRVRSRFPEIRLHVVGTWNVQADEKDYFPSLEPLLREHASWVTVHQDLPRKEMASLLARQRFSIHAQEDEHFGMAVAETLAAGCIPFVHNSGGPPDIVGNDPRLLYLDEDEAVARITSVLANPDEQQDILSRLAPRRQAYSAEVFVAAIRDEVRLALAQQRV